VKGAGMMTVTLVGSRRTIGPVDMNQAYDTGEGVFLTSPDGRHVSYLIRRSDGWFFVVDGMDHQIKGPVSVFLSASYDVFSEHITLRYYTGTNALITVIEPTLSSSLIIR
jgi:hypothetical protein